MTLFSEAGLTTYVVKVKAKTTMPKTYLFGSNEVSQIDGVFQGKLVLVFRIDPDGEPIEIKAIGQGNEYRICRLSPGETYAWPLYNVSGVWAEQPDADTRVHCALIPQPA